MTNRELRAEVDDFLADKSDEQKALTGELYTFVIGLRVEFRERYKADESVDEAKVEGELDANTPDMASFL